MSHWYWQFNRLRSLPGEWRVEYRFRGELEWVQRFNMDCAADTIVDTCNMLDDDCDGEVDEFTPNGCSCSGDDLALQWPIDGQDAQDWVTVNYLDLDRSGGIRDYHGGRKTYDGHTGLDISIPSFREMDGPNYAYVRASARGQVISVVDHHADRHTSCVDHNNNVIIIEHENGYQTRYYHNKKNSAQVSVGQVVEMGDPIAIVGSSGCSTAPHIHFEVRDCEGHPISPFVHNLWINGPVYHTPFGLMDLFIKDGAFTNVNQLKDPPNDASVIRGGTLGIGLSTAGGDATTVFSVKVYQPNGVLYREYTFDYTRSYTHALWRLTYPLSNLSGEWRVDVVYENQVIRSKTFLR